MAIFNYKYNGIPGSPSMRRAANKIPMEKLRKKFPVLQQCLYANTASSGLLGEGLLEWRQGHDLDYLIGGSEMKNKAMSRLGKVRETVGSFFHCPGEQVALVPNFSLGLNLLLEGLPKDQRVLLLQADYPSVNWPFETRGFPREYLAIDQNLEANIRERVKGGKIDVLALSLVQWVNGVMIDLDFLRELKTEFPQLLIVADGTQYLGMEVFDFQASGIDILGASAYKWLLAGYGNGFFLIREGVEERFDLKGIGHGSVEGDASMRDRISFCKMLEPGHLDSLNFGSLDYALKFLNEIGQDNIATQVQRLSQRAMEAFGSLGILDPYVPDRKKHSGIFLVHGDENLLGRLREQQVVASPRGGGVRLSFHFYNTLEEVDQLAKLLKRWVSK